MIFQVVDLFLTSHTLGHETSDVLVEKVVQTLVEKGIDFSKMICLSRDNPSVMKALDRKLRERALAEGNPALLEFPDYLHPTHTALREGVKKLNVDLEKFLINVYGFFKLSSARRCDLLEVREIFEDNDEFFLRFVSSRWLTMGPVAERMVEHWASTTKYFLTYLPSQVDSSSKDACKTDRYRDIVQILKPTQNVKNLARMRLLIHLCRLNRPFLTMFQAEKPMIHRLYFECTQLIKVYMTLVCDVEHIPSNPRNYSKINFKDISVIMPSHKCNFGVRFEEEFVKLSETDQHSLRREARDVVVRTIEYLISHYPLENQLLINLYFMDPDFKGEQVFLKKLLGAAKILNRFSSAELDDLSIQLNTVKTLLNMKPFDEKIDHLDHVWVKIVGQVFKVLGEYPEALEKFVMIVCALPHSQAFLERGFSTLKRLITGRESLAKESTDAQKTILDHIKLAGGSKQVQITPKMIGMMKQAHARREEAQRKKILEETKERGRNRQQEQDRERKRMVEEENQSWESEVKVKKEAIKVLKALLTDQNDALAEALKKATETANDVTRKAALRSAKVAQNNMKQTRGLVEEAEKQLLKVVGKKPKTK